MGGNRCQAARLQTSHDRKTRGCNTTFERIGSCAVKVAKLLDRAHSIAPH